METRSNDRARTTRPRNSSRSIPVRQRTRLSLPPQRLSLDPGEIRTFRWLGRTPTMPQEILQLVRTALPDLVPRSVSQI